MNKRLKLILFVTLPIFAIFLIFDLLSKHLIDSSLSLGEVNDFLPGFIEILTVHNTGAAWGIFANSQIFLIILTFLFVFVLFGLMIFEKTENPLFYLALGFIFSGAIGNLIDRLAFGYVRDFLHLEFWPTFPVFNIADMCLTVGVVLFIVYFIYMIVNHRKKHKEDKIDN